MRAFVWQLNNFVNLLQIAFLVYCGFGILVYIYALQTGRLFKIDSSTKGASQSFFILIAPSFVLLWPFLKIRQPNQKSKNSELPQLQSKIWLLLSFVIFVFMVLAIVQRTGELNGSIPPELIGK